MVKEKISEQQWQLRDLWVGIGCQSGSSLQLIETAIEQVFKYNQLDRRAIAGFATINTKASEVALVELCRLRNLPIKTFTAEILSTVSVPNPAKIIEAQVGTPSVAEAAAILAASHPNSSNCSKLLPVPAKLKVRLLIPKQIFRLHGQLKAVTLAVAQECEDKGYLHPLSCIHLTYLTKPL
ncbi:cobalamin biosynthesis protein [Dendronalium sp. ChiSLP03b]|uniref:cobalamin biosynthesis protein n=1 Tax=Dendronalium sp. ChiSLP03b TaxID=3075381 RepID=UPI002AD5ADBF|nr:cobalamin biosynthesis protein [Dendronalium sp. ChiSLP03b]MDZ8207958.1 cobalamin biosynthesis protein [Dendronalium sp. ChiSLP03b]